MQKIKEPLSPPAQHFQKRQQSISLRSVLSNLLLTATGVGLMIWSLRLIQTWMNSVISKDAAVNGIVIDLKTPSEGMITKLSVNTGDISTQGQVLIQMENQRASRLTVQEITSRLNGQKAFLKETQAQLARQLALVKILEAERHSYHQLRIQESQQSVAEVKANLKAAQSRLQVAQVNYERTKRLTAEGALAQAELDTATLKMKESEAEITNLEARLEGLGADVKAAQLDLSLDWSSSNFDPKIRWQQLQLDIADRRQALQTLQEAIKNTQTELTEAQVDLKRQQSIVIRAPTSGIIWRLNAQVGQFIRAGDSLGQVLDCNRRWVDVYLEERALRGLKPGMPATIELYGSDSEVLQGRISLVRSGIGRLAAGEDVAIPLIPNLPRQSQVRVELQPGTKKGMPNLFCYVGYTAKVTFKVK